MRHDTRPASPPVNGRSSGCSQRRCLRAVGRAAVRSYAMSFRLLTDATVVPYLAFIAPMVAASLALHRVQSLKALRDRTG